MDAVSDDGRHALVIIAMLGSPFSPNYGIARDEGEITDPLAYSAMNVAVYSRGASAWSLAERIVTPAERGSDGLAIGDSTMRWDGDRLVVDIVERTTPGGRPIRGRVVVTPRAHACLELAIDRERRHLWWPVAPLARVEASFSSPSLSFSGPGYHDANAGDVPLEASFDRWSWSRAERDGAALVTYDARGKRHDHCAHAFRLDEHGRFEELEGLVRRHARPTVWALPRTMLADPGARVRVRQSLENGPFYSRAILETTLGGKPVVAVHETLAAHRLTRAWVRRATWYRMTSESPRRYP